MKYIMKYITYSSSLFVSREKPCPILFTLWKFAYYHSQITLLINLAEFTQYFRRKNEILIINFDLSIRADFYLLLDTKTTAKHKTLNVILHITI